MFKSLCLLRSFLKANSGKDATSRARGGAVRGAEVSQHCGVHKLLSAIPSSLLKTPVAAQLTNASRLHIALDLSPKKGS